MKKLLSFAVAAALMLSLLSCAAGNNAANNARKNINRVGYKVGTDVRRMAQPNTNIDVVGAYRDGVYTALGDTHINGNEQATIIVRNGRIAEVGLINVGPQNMPFYEIGNGTAINHAGRLDNLAGDGLGMSNPPGSNNQTGGAIGTRTAVGGWTPLPSSEDQANHFRTMLAGRIVQQQSADVDVSSSDAVMGTAVANWKLAVRRALDQARR